MSAPESQRPSSLACVPCRNKHLRCDAKTPVCGRCQDKSISCNYIPSMRGFRRSKDPKSAGGGAQNPTSEILGETDESRDVNLQFPHGLDCISIKPSVLDLEGNRDSSWTYNSGSSINAARLDISSYSNLPNASTGSCVDLMFLDDTNLNEESLTEAQSRPPEGESENALLINLYYDHFHPAHPILMPQKLLRQQKFKIPEYLQAVVVFIGSHFSKVKSKFGTRSRAIEVLRDEKPREGHLVQALILLAVAFHARFEEQECLDALKKASELAVELRMFENTYACVNGHGNSTLAESWRRTWWELLALDVLLPTFHSKKVESRLQNIKTNLFLPSEEPNYAMCQPPQQMKTREDFNSRLFQDDSSGYSSFAYKVDAIRLLHVVRLALKGTENISPSYIDSSLSNFFLSLPESKREVINVDGTVDEVLFSAHIIANTASLLFHRSHSTFAYMIHHQPTECTTQDTSKIAIMDCPFQTSKALGAADRLSNAVGAHLSIKRRSPFLSCAIALAASIHLPACITPLYAKNQPTLKERLQLSISALQMIGEVWLIARFVKAQIAKFAREVLLNSQELNPSYPLELESHSAQLDSLVSDDSWLDYLASPGDQTSIEMMDNS